MLYLYHKIMGCDLPLEVISMFNASTIIYKEAVIRVRGGEWLDYMNSCFYRVIDTVFYDRYEYNICIEKGADVVFALPTGQYLD